MKKLTFEEFVNEIKENIPAYLPEEIKDAEITVEEVAKYNGRYTGLGIRHDVSAVQLFNLDNIYQIFLVTGNLQEILENIADSCRECPDIGNIDMGVITDYSFVKEHLIIKVSDPDRNAECLRSVPHKIVGGMAVTYHVKAERIGTLIIDGQLLKRYGISEEQLHEDALKSSAKLAGPIIETLAHETFGGFVVRYGRNGNRPFEEMLEDVEPGLLLLTNRSKTYGASVMMYPGVLEKIADKLGESFYILPSSVNEVLIMPVSKVPIGMDLESMENMVRDINATVLLPEDVLSDKILYFEYGTNTMRNII